MSDFPTMLRERFDECAYWYQSGWEHDPKTRIVNNTVTGRDPALEEHESEMIELFESLRDSVDSIPAALIADVEARRVSLGEEPFDAIFELAVEAVGRQSFPNSAADFIGTLILNLQFAVGPADQLRRAL